MGFLYGYYPDGSSNPRALVRAVCTKLRLGAAIVMGPLANLEVEYKNNSTVYIYQAN